MSGKNLLYAVDYCNHQNLHYFLITGSDTVTITTFAQDVERNIRVNQMPLVLSLKNLNDTNWLYTLGADHAVSVYSFQDASTVADIQIGIADPWIGYLGNFNFSSTYLVDISTIRSHLFVYLY